MFRTAQKSFIRRKARRYLFTNFQTIRKYQQRGFEQFEGMLVAILRLLSTPGFAPDTSVRLISKRTLAGRRKLCSTAVPYIFSWKKDSPKKRKPPKSRHTGANIDNEELETQESNSFDNAFRAIEVETEVETEVDDHIENDRTTKQEENILELKERMENLEKKLKEFREALEAEKDKTKALDIKLRDAQKVVIDLTTRCQEYEKKTFCSNKFKDSKSMAFYTGFPSVELFDAVYDFCDPGEDGENIRYWHSSSTNQNTTVVCEPIESVPKPGRRRLLHPKEELFITLCRLRQGFGEEHLAHLYGVSQATISRIIITWVNFLYLKFKDVPMWPSRELINKHMPEQFKEKYPSTRVIIDCTEVQCQMPSSLRLNSELFSSYKNHTTLKALVGITPGGALSFVSQLYTGHISDREIVLRSGFLEQKFNNGDSVMADKGFTVQDLLPPGVGLNIPPFLGSQGQMSPDDVVKTQSIASLRVHVERAINKIKNFHIWDGVVPLNLFGVVNQMWTVCAVLCNLQKPTISV